MRKRIISDVIFYDDEKRKGIFEEAQEVLRYLDQKGILKKISFRYHNYKNEEINFALDTEDLLPYKEQVLNDLPNLKGGIERVFDAQIQPCIFCGAISVVTPMITYRSNGGCVGKSRECSVCQSYDSKMTHQFAEEAKKNGQRAAVELQWEDFIWNN